MAAKIKHKIYIKVYKLLFLLPILLIAQKYFKN